MMTFAKVSRTEKSFVYFLHSFEGSYYVFNNMETTCFVSVIYNFHLTFHIIQNNYLPI